MVAACTAAACSDSGSAPRRQNHAANTGAAGGDAAEANGAASSAAKPASTAAGTGGSQSTFGGDFFDPPAGSDHDNGGSGGSAGSAGVGGGGSSSAGSAGSVDSAGQGGDGGVALGEGGQAQLPPAGQACVACGAEQCGGVLGSCGQNPECAPWLECLTGCDTPACASACDASYAEVARVYYGVYSCLCNTCAAACVVAQSCDKKCVADDVLPPTNSAPGTVAETGLYAVSDGAAPQLAPYVRGYDTNFPLWADGAGKDRYIYVPRCATIDTSDMDHWSFPVGTRLWKQFTVDGKLVETRMIHRYGSGTSDWLYATYGWDAAQPDDPAAAVIVLHGEPNANGTLHDIPDPSACPACHGKLPDKALGFSAFQLSHTGDGLTMQKLSDWGWLTLPARDGFAVPGTPVEQAALGYLHGNCGGCHNSFGEIPRENPMLLRLNVAQSNYAETDTLRTTIGVPTVNAYPELHGKPRIDPQQPNNSAIFLRMSDRDKFPMPPLATKFPDTDGGVAAITAWINSLPK